MGNQQERSLYYYQSNEIVPDWGNPVLMSWLAGILDGEGTVSVQVYTLPDGRVRLTPFVSIVNTDEGILKGCREALDWVGVKYRNCGKPLSVGQFNGTLTPVNLRIDGQEPVEKLLTVVEPYLRSVKRKYANYILAYLESRRSRGLQRDELGRVRRVEYSRTEIELISECRTHKRAKSSEAICQAPNVVG